jgi:cytochrome P450
MTLPNGPQTLPLLQMLHWIARPFSFMDACARKYGDIFTVPLSKNFAPVVFVSNPQALQQILSSDSKEFDAPGDTSLNQLFQPFLGEHSVITLSGDRHRRQRQLLMPPFHGERMRAYSQLISNITEQIISQWKIGQPFAIRDSMQAISLRVILRAVFGLNEGPRYRQLEELLNSMLNVTSSPLSVSMLYFPILRQDLGPLSPWGRFLRQKQQIDQLLYAEIQERRDQPDSSRTDILTLLMSARDQADELMTDVELRDELMTLLLAGHETTATAITWALYWIHKLPKVRDKLLQELDCLGDHPEASAILRLPYLNAVCSETLRIYPIGMLTFPRVVKSPCELIGYQLDPGTVLIGSIYLTHQREDVYPEPKQFKPERFLERQFSPYEYLPFGAGSRRCIGMAFAQFEMKIVLAKILSRFEMALADNRPVRPLRRGLVSAPSSVRLVLNGQRSESSQKHQLSSSNV